MEQALRPIFLQVSHQM